MFIFKMYSITSVLLLVTMFVTQSVQTYKTVECMKNMYLIELYEHEPTCPDIPIVFLQNLDGFTGHGLYQVSVMMLEFLSAWTTLKSLDKESILYIPKYFSKELNIAFDNSDFLPIESLENCANSNNFSLTIKEISSSSEDLATLKMKLNEETGNIFISKIPIFYTAIVEYYNEIRSHFKFQKYMNVLTSKAIDRYVQEFYKENPYFNGKATTVGIFVKRNVIGQTPASPEYFLQAMDMFRAHSDVLGKPIFLLMSDELPWIYTNLMQDQNDTFIVSFYRTRNVGELNCMALCDNIVIDSVDDLGVLAGVLVRGIVLSSDTNQEVVKAFSTFPNWQFISDEILK